ncbi:MAG: alkene reductase, partial [Flavobacteriaceae bacterium]
VMAPMTRSRALNNIPNDHMVTYYEKRADAGLIITEGTAPSANGLGYPRIPGIYTDNQLNGWKKITTAVHAKGGKIFLQLMHTGRVSHALNMEEGTQILAPSSVALSGEIYTDIDGMKPYPIPEEMTLSAIEQTQQEFVQAAKNAIKVGFDGVEIHGANGYLIEQFINTASNIRKDNYGGSIENRSRFAIEVSKKVADAIGADRTGIRLSPYGVFNGMEIFESVDETFEYLATEIGKLNLAYIHIVDHSSQGAPEVPQRIKDTIKTAFKGDFIASGGLNLNKAETILKKDKGDLVAFGVPFIANPDLVYRFKNNKALSSPNPDTFFSAGIEGYLDYPSAN